MFLGKRLRPDGTPTYAYQHFRVIDAMRKIAAAQRELSDVVSTDGDPQSLFEGGTVVFYRDIDKPLEAVYEKLSELRQSLEPMVEAESRS